MNLQTDLDRLLAASLEDGPSRAPKRSIDAALAHAHAHPRRRHLLAFLQADPMGTPSPRSPISRGSLRLVAILGLVLVIGLAVAGAGGLFNSQPVVVPPVVSPAPVPPTSASPVVIFVDLLEHVGADATIDITDLSGRLISAESGDPGFNATVANGSVSAARLDADPKSLVLTWGGLPCDTTHRLTIQPDGRTMTIVRTACDGDSDTLAVDHEVQLHFDRPIDPALVRVTIEIGPD